MVEEILKEIGLSYAKTMFAKPPGLQYIVYFDDIKRRGADDQNMINDHDVTFEFYSNEIDLENEAKIEKALNKKAIEFTRDREFIQSEKNHETIYQFSFVEKEEEKENG